MSRLKTRKCDPKLHLLIVSDTHIDHKHPIPIIPQRLLRGAIKDAQEAQTKVDAFVVIGDVTSRGSVTNWEMAKAVFDKAGPPAERCLLAIGNHDTWSDDGVDKAFERYYAYTAAITGEPHDKPYFSAWINGVPLIFLGSEGDCGCEAELSEEQFVWFEAEMKKAAQTGLPILVFCHQPINQTHGLPRTSCVDETDTDPMDGGVGVPSDRLLAIMKPYEHVFYFSGHSHMGFAGEKSMAEEGYSSFEVQGGLTFVNLPSLACGNHHCEQGRLGLGLQLEIYEHEIFLTPRDVKRHCTLRCVPIQDGKPYFKQKF